MQQRGVGFYTLGVLKEIEGMVKCPLHKRFDLVLNTSAGAIIAALIALGYKIKYVPKILQILVSSEKVEGTQRVALTHWDNEAQMIFKNDGRQVHK